MLSALTPDKGRGIDTLMANLVMMQTVCKALDKSNCGHFIYFSSDAVYDTSINRVSEHTPESPKDLYGTMHLAREAMARSLNNIQLLILRPTAVYGISDTHNSYGPNRFRKSAQEDRTITLFGAGEETRDHLYVEDLARLSVHCLLKGTIGTLYVATGISTSFYEVAEAISKEFSNEIDVITTPRVNPITHRHYDPTSLIKAFPSFSFTPLKDGIALVHQGLTNPP